MTPRRSASEHAIKSAAEAHAQRRDQILLTVASIPPGRVATYGEVAEAAGLPGCARLVGRVLRTLPDGSGIPWHRVVAAGGRIAIRATLRPGSGAHEQIARLRAEGVRLRGKTESARVDLATSSWRAR